MNKHANYSFDLETLGTASDSYILSIGCAKFDILTGEIIDTFYKKVSSSIVGFSIDIETVKWWMKQNEYARMAITAGKETPLLAALCELNNFIAEDSLVWGNGSTFDITILENAYKIIGDIPHPWKFWNIRDLRTLVNAASVIGFNHKQLKHVGVYHDALADAVHQAKIAANALNYIINEEYLPDEEAKG